METFKIIWHHKEKQHYCQMRAARIPVIGEEIFLPYSLTTCKNTKDAHYTGTYNRITAVRWKPCSSNFCEGMYAQVFLNFAESYEPKEEVF